jgi:hypothetical protein
MAWVHYTGKAGTTQDFAKIAIKSPIDAGAFVSWAMGLDNAVAGSQKLVFNINVADAIKTATGATNFPVGSWAHAAGIYDGATMKCYLNGVEDGATSQTGDIVVDPATDDNLYLGMYRPANTSNNLWSGRIAEFAMWKNVALPVNTVLAIARGMPISRVLTPASLYLPLYLPTEADWSGNGHVVTVSGTFPLNDHPPVGMMWSNTPGSGVTDLVIDSGIGNPFRLRRYHRYA